MVHRNKVTDYAFYGFGYDCGCDFAAGFRGEENGILLDLCRDNLFAHNAEVVMQHVFASVHGSYHVLSGYLDRNGLVVRLWDDLLWQDLDKSLREENKISYM